MNRAKKLWARAWPWIAAGGFWTAAGIQAFTILQAQDAGSVSGATWLVGAVTLAGFALYYHAFLHEEARLAGVTVSIIGSILYAGIFILTVIY
jgi:hypothetical protein